MKPEQSTLIKLQGQDKHKYSYSVHDTVDSTDEAQMVKPAEHLSPRVLVKMA